MGDCLWADQPSWYIASDPDKLNLVIPLWVPVDAMSTSQSWDKKVCGL